MTDPVSVQSLTNEMIDTLQLSTGHSGEFWDQDAAVTYKQVGGDTRDAAFHMFEARMAEIMAQDGMGDQIAVDGQITADEMMAFYRNEKRDVYDAFNHTAKRLDISQDGNIDKGELAFKANNYVEIYTELLNEPYQLYLDNPTSETKEKFVNFLNSDEHDNYVQRRADMQKVAEQTQQ